MSLAAYQVTPQADTAEAPESAVSSEAASVAASPLLTLNAPSDNWPNAQVQGALTERAGCLFIAGNIAVFPHDTTWDNPEVLFTDGTRAALGTRVNLGGGFWHLGPITQDDLPTFPISRVQVCADRTGISDFVLAGP